MNSRVTMVLAGLLLVGAVIAGYWGLSLSRQPEVVVAEPVEPPESVPAITLPSLPLINQEDEPERVPVVVLAQAVTAMSTISAEDLLVEELRVAPPGSFAESEALVGRVVWRDLPAGTVLNESSFETGGPLARMIRPEERALAIQVDEVVSGGGHIQPGDYVDVLLFLKEDERNSDRTVQVVVPALRVLTVGSALGADRTGEPLMAPVAEDEKDSRANRRVEQARTAVLALPEGLMTRFMLASEVGKLRLAVRSIDEKLLAEYQAGKALEDKVEDLNRQLFQFEKLALRQAKRPQPGLVPVRPAGIPVYHGSDVARQYP
ncbi:Flp pilus assembly protein CpaB [Pseudomonas sp. MYb185]|uniref:Flp pilus assembly protein CpaB n=1 Tax=Pseudomonas sp. MYb185 TaxID=1848729 RepID=UPI000CFE32F1|nr:Flp pilus assembly protein CpaB [Pseudomonas sp. MYb185]PRB83824.1 Flp pilus assembly protein CpaB [Pseudomonas sp. MYb185]